MLHIKYEKFEHDSYLHLGTSNNSEFKMLHTTTVVNKIGRRKILINHKVIIVIIVDKLCNPVLIGLDVIETVNTVVDQKTMLFCLGITETMYD